MRALDTNVLLRYLMQDDVPQAAQATRLMESLTPTQPGFVPLLVVVELVWVLSRIERYGLERALEVVDALLCTDALRIENAALVRRAMRRCRLDGVGFSDALIALSAADEGCQTVYSFDRTAIAARIMTALD